ncbi:hypothetical protein AX16_006243 [Volvariella volvacea WC 439]|nr:hypothetical protein AX16_006243 [Volvariella volvacea WC 439]
MEAERAARAAKDAERGPPRWPERVATLLRPRSRRDTESREEGTSDGRRANRRRGSILRNLRPDMIRRIDSAPKPVNPSGWVSEDAVGVTPNTRPPPPPLPPPVPAQISQDSGPTEQTPSPKLQMSFTPRSPLRRLSDPGIPSRPPSPEPAYPLSESPISHDTHSPDNASHSHAGFPRTQTVEWAPSVSRRRSRRVPLQPLHDDSVTEVSPSEDYRSARRSSIAATHITARSHAGPQDSKHSGFGGFPTPATMVSKLLDRFFPQFTRKIRRTVTMPMTTSLVSQGAAPSGVTSGSAKVVPYISFDAVVGRNSSFHHLTSEQLEELGGVEYRALNALLWIVAIYHIGIQLIGYIIIAPYMSISRWRDDFVPPALLRPLAPAWFSMFQVVSAYTNTGMSLVDQSMLPFQTAYPLILVMIFLILAGNTCFTSGLDWLFFMILDIGNSVIESIPIGTRLLAGLMQGIAVRAAGFAIVPLASLAPAVKVLYVVMMYISVFPIAMSVRSTNVYEEKSLGIYPTEDYTEDQDFNPEGARSTVWSKYLTMHARKQLAFDMWWLAFALFLVCIVERGMINDPQNFEWFNIFNILFELVSAYGTVGLSLGIPDQNYSFSGAFKPLSKLIVCAVMIRGRHRGLPVAIDRAVVLPWVEENRFQEQPQEFPRQASIITNGHLKHSVGIFSDNKSNHFSHGRSSPFDEKSGHVTPLGVDHRTPDGAN